jgi:hypothetical protein
MAARLLPTTWLRTILVPPHGAMVSADLTGVRACATWKSVTASGRSDWGACRPRARRPLVLGARIAQNTLVSGGTARADGQAAAQFGAEDTHHAHNCRGCSSLTERGLLEGRRPVHQTERLRLRPSCGTQHPDEAVRVKGREPRGRAGEGYEGEKGGLALRGKMLTAR